MAAQRVDSPVVSFETWPRQGAPTSRHHRSVAIARFSIVAALVIVGVMLPTRAATARSAAAAFQVQGIFPFGPAHVGVAYNDSVDVALATDRSHYTVTAQSGTPAVTLDSVAVQDNQRTAVLIFSGRLPMNGTFDVAISGVTSLHGDPLVLGGPTTFSTGADTVVGIADVHANIASLVGRTITVIGQVYLRGSSSGGTPSAYIQDGTRRGLNLFGNPLLPATDTLGTVVKATGTVLYYADVTVELTPYTASAIATHQPHLAPRELPSSQAASHDWEGTYIKTTATLTGPPVESGAYNFNFPAGASFLFRVRKATGIDTSGYRAGNSVTGTGAGAASAGVYQIIVGNAEDFGHGPPDVTPPRLVSASGAEGSNQIAVEFDELVGLGAGTASNYTVYATATPASPIAVTAAQSNGSTVTLTIAATLESSVGYTVKASNVQDQAGNTIAPGSTVSFTVPASPLRVTGVFQFGGSYLGIGFSKKLNATQAVDATRYAFTPALTIAQIKLQDNGQTAILRSNAPLPTSTSYTVLLSGITSAAGEPLESDGPYAWSTASETVVDIATLFADPGTYAGRIVTVIGQAYVPVSSRGGTPSGYIQDGSGRGLNVFGGSTQAAVNAIGNVAKVTGKDTLYFTTLEIMNYTATLLASNQPPLKPRVLGMAAANSSEWEGTYIQTSGTLTSIAASGTSNYNYDATDGSSNITFRVGNGLGISPANFAIGDLVTGAGAGGAFQTTFQINIGNVSDFYRGGGGPVPPAPTAAANARLLGPDGGAFPATTLLKTRAGPAESFAFLISGAPNAKAVCRIFDLKGRLVKVLFDGKLTGATPRSLTWDARNESFERVPAGLYICHLETTDLSGHVSQDRAPIVVSVRL